MDLKSWYIQNTAGEEKAKLQVGTFLWGRFSLVVTGGARLRGWAFSDGRHSLVPEAVKTGRGSSVHALAFNNQLLALNLSRPYHHVYNINHRLSEPTSPIRLRSFLLTSPLNPSRARKFANMAPPPSKVDEAKSLTTSDPKKAEALYREVLAKSPGSNQAALQEYENALVGLGELYRDQKQTDALAELIKTSRSTLSSFAKAKTAKLGRVTFGHT